MKHFEIIQSLCRTSILNNDNAAAQQVRKLVEALRKDTDPDAKQQALILDRMLRRHGLQQQLLRFLDQADSPDEKELAHRMLEAFEGPQQLRRAS